MNESPQNGNSNNIQKRPQKPLLERLIKGNLSHLMPISLAVVWIVISFIAGTPIIYTILVLFVLIPLWCIYRFGYQFQVNQLLKGGKYQQAVDVCFKALQSFPDDTFLLVKIASAYESLGQYEKAEEYVEQAIQRGERLPEAYVVQTKTIVHYYLEQQKNLIEASAANVEGATARHVTPDQLAEEKIKYKAVLKSMETAFETQKLTPPFLNINLAYYFVQLGMVERAESELAKIEGNDNPKVRAYVLSNRARILLIRGENEKALELARQSTELLAPDSGLLTTYGLMLLRNDRVDEAISNFDKVISNTEAPPLANIEAHYFRAEALEKKGDTRKAEQDRETALRNGYVPYL
ncbi:MAG: hypothetical protein C0469_17445 [Cyanobacteria bacterium DS2.3.42]|nr:hypothetical protein [Cyanobacteria bacterium DS2.3.42]